LLAVFVFMWVPSGVLIWMLPLCVHIRFYGGRWSHSQGLISACLYL
jgi:hypothetical protein